MPRNKVKLPKWNKRVKKILIDKNMTVRELAAIIGYSDVYVRNVINGKIVNASAVEEKINKELKIN